MHSYALRIQAESVAHANLRVRTCTHTLANVREASYGRTHTCSFDAISKYVKCVGVSRDIENDEQECVKVDIGKSLMKKSHKINLHST